MGGMGGTERCLAGDGEGGRRIFWIFEEGILQGEKGYERLGRDMDVGLGSWSGRDWKAEGDSR